MSLSTDPRIETAPRAEAPRRAARSRRLLGLLAWMGVLLLVGVISISAALRLAPPVTVSTLGQRVTVSTAAPSLSLSGPGEIVLFGRTLPTQVDFLGPMRPRLVLDEITIDRQLVTAFTRGHSLDSTASVLGERLAAGWRSYILGEILWVTAIAVLLLGAVAGWRRHGWRESIITILVGTAVAQAMNLGAIAVAVNTVPERLGGIQSLGELVGRDPVRPIRAGSGPSLAGVEAVVIGDSTAAGLGGPELLDATRDDRACRRSSTSFAQTLQRVNGWDVENLACSGATIRRGVLGAQRVGGRRIEPQLADALRAPDLQVVILSVGANDLRWSALIGMCALADRCDDRAQAAFFQRALDRFTGDYYRLLRQLAQLRGEPDVVVNAYYAPFETSMSECLAPVGLSAAKVKVLLARLDALNSVLESGAETFGFTTARPDFSGHGICSDQPYVQGLGAPAPLHPNARGQLAIALADQAIR